MVKGYKSSAVKVQKPGSHCLLQPLFFILSVIFALNTQAQCIPATATPSSQTICSNSITSVALTGIPPGATFTWTTTPTGVAGSSDCLGPCGTTIAQTLTTTGTVAGTVIYTIIQSKLGCPDIPIFVTVTVKSLCCMCKSKSRLCFCLGTKFFTLESIPLWKRTSIRSHICPGFKNIWFQYMVNHCYPCFRNNFFDFNWITYLPDSQKSTRKQFFWRFSSGTLGNTSQYTNRSRPKDRDFVAF